LVAAFPAVAPGGIAAAGVELAGMAVTAGTEAGAGMAGVAGGIQAGVGLIPVGAGELASALVGAGVTRMRIAIPTIITPIIRITHTIGRTRMRQRTRTGIAVTTEICVKIRRSEIQSRRDRLA
jgi:hypothetical protein